MRNMDTKRVTEKKTLPPISEEEDGEKEEGGRTPFTR